MKYVDEYRDGAAARALGDLIRRTATRPWVIMEVCGGQTHPIVRYGIDALLPPLVELVHGPGGPVCVTRSRWSIERTRSRRDVTFCSFGDMLRVPGSRGDLLTLKSEGRGVRVVYSPLDAVDLAAANSGRRMVFFAIGFETTAPANAMAVGQARRRRLTNSAAIIGEAVADHPGMVTQRSRIGGEGWWRC